MHRLPKPIAYFLVATASVAGALLPLSVVAKSKPFELSKVSGRTFRLVNGPVNICPDKIAIELDASKQELKLFPMELEWQKVRSGVNPLLVVRGMRRPWEPERANVVSSGNTKSSYSALLEDNRIDSVTRTSVEDSVSIESHAQLEFRGDKFLLKRWSMADGAMLSETQLCSYKESRLLQTAQASTLSR